mmetsp:Transcript_10450/g.43199  ORF Transcript_10450/g.43199 Transcript_10450/m.43199 type:complete len:438 (-) Transcript_10450:106-1419(-)
MAAMTPRSVRARSARRALGSTVAGASSVAAVATASSSAAASSAARMAAARSERMAERTSRPSSPWEVAGWRCSLSASVVAAICCCCAAPFGTRSGEPGERQRLREIAAASMSPTCWSTRAAPGLYAAAPHRARARSAAPRQPIAAIGSAHAPWGALSAAQMYTSYLYAPSPSSSPAARSAATSARQSSMTACRSALAWGARSWTTFPDAETRSISSPSRSEAGASISKRTSRSARAAATTRARTTILPSAPRVAMTSARTRCSSVSCCRATSSPLALSLLASPDCGEPPFSASAPTCSPLRSPSHMDASNDAASASMAFFAAACFSPSQSSRVSSSLRSSSAAEKRASPAAARAAAALTPVPPTPTLAPPGCGPRAPVRSTSVTAGRASSWERASPFAPLSTSNCCVPSPAGALKSPGSRAATRSPSAISGTSASAQ